MKITACINLTALSILTLQGCGGGGGSTTAPAAVVAATVTVFPSIVPSVGDYFVYSTSINPTLPTGAAPSQYETTRLFTVANPDGSFSRTDTTSRRVLSNALVFSSSAALVSTVSGSQTCNFTPPFRNGPPLSAALGTSYSTTSSQSCVVQSQTPAATTSIKFDGSVQTAEPLTIALGTFATVKDTHIIVSSSATASTTTTATCWTDTVTGRTVQCTSAEVTTPVGQTVPSASDTRSFVLEAYSFRGNTPVGPAVKRFNGYWNLVSASGQGRCNNLFVDSNGGINATCQTLDQNSNVTSTFTVTGTVDVSGTATFTGSNGLSGNGSFSSPVSATGTISNAAGTTVTWAATHI